MANSPEHSDILIIGGGISGLTTAYYLKKQGHDVRVIEAGEAPGGNIGSLHERGWLIERGPNSTLENDPALTALIDELGLRPQVTEANAVANTRYVVKQGQVLPLPASPKDLLGSRLFSAKDVLRLAKEPFIKRGEGEESIQQFVSRRLGKGFLDWAVDPFVSGVYAGDPRSLSVQAATPKIFALEAEYGSLIRGAFKRMRQKKQAGRGLQTMPSGKMISFTRGMDTLTGELAVQLGERLHTGLRARQVNRHGDRWEVTTEERLFTANRLILATPAHVSGRLLQWVDPPLADMLGEVIYPPVASVALGFRRDQVKHPLDGFGMLIPSREQRQTLGALFSSSLFPNRAPAGHVLLTAFIGGRRNPEAAQGSHEAVIERVMHDLRELLGIDGEPTMTRINRWNHAIPQYELGYLERLKRMDARLEKLHGLTLRANWRDGISVVDCVKNAKELAQSFGQPLTQAGPGTASEEVATTQARTATTLRAASAA